MTVNTHYRGLGNTLTPLKAELVQMGEDGTYSAVDLSGKKVYFRMEDSQGNDVIGPGTGADNDCAISDPQAGLVYYDFTEDQVSTAGTYYGYFDVYDSNWEYDTFPPRKHQLKIVIA